MQAEGLTFDEENKVHIMPPSEREEAEKVVKSAQEYEQALQKFDETSVKVTKQIDVLAEITEAKRGESISLKALNEGAELEKGHNLSMGRAKLSCRNYELECSKMEVNSFELFLEDEKKTKTAVVEIFGTE